MAKRLPNKELATVTELIVSTLATSDTLAKLLIEKALVTFEARLFDLLSMRGRFHPI